MKDFINALISRHIQTADHVRPRTRGWFDTQAVFEDEPEEETTAADEQAFTGTTQERTSGKSHLIIQQTEYHEPNIVGEIKSDPPVIARDAPKEDRDTLKPSPPVHEIKPLSENTPWLKSEAVTSGERSIKKTVQSQQKSSLPGAPSIVEKLEGSNPAIRVKRSALPLLEDVTEKLQAETKAEPIMPPIRSMKRNMLPEPEQKAVSHQSIDVTIGRVEIQAVFPPVEKSRASKKRKQRNHHTG